VNCSFGLDVHDATGGGASRARFAVPENASPLTPIASVSVRGSRVLAGRHRQARRRAEDSGRSWLTPSSTRWRSGSGAEQRCREVTRTALEHARNCPAKEVNVTNPTIPTTSDVTTEAPLVPLWRGCSADSTVVRYSRSGAQPGITSIRPFSAARFVAARVKGRRGTRDRTVRGRGWGGRSDRTRMLGQP
jgi:hypothetical protein